MTSGASLWGQAASSVGSTIDSLLASRQHRKYASKQIDSTLSNFKYQTRALNNRYAEEIERTNQERQLAYLENMQARATAVASAAGNGVEGTSIDSLFIGYDRAAAVNNYLTDRELRLKNLQYEDNIDALRAEAISSVNLLQPFNGSSVNFFSTLGNVISSYGKTKTT